MDGVLADVYTRFFELHELETGERLNISDVAGLLEAEAFPNQRKWVTAPGFFRSVPVMPGSQSGIDKVGFVLRYSGCFDGYRISEQSYGQTIMAHGIFPFHKLAADGLLW